jgi:hypothetical protein
MLRPFLPLSHLKNKSASALSFLKVNIEIEDSPCAARQSVSLGPVFTSLAVARANYLQFSSPERSSCQGGYVGVAH